MDEKIENMMNDPIYLINHYADCAPPQAVTMTSLALLIWGGLIILTSVRFWRLARWIALRAYLALNRYLVRRRLARAPQPATGLAGLAHADEGE